MGHRAERKRPCRHLLLQSVAYPRIEPWEGQQPSRPPKRRANEGHKHSRVAWSPPLSKRTPGFPGPPRLRPSLSLVSRVLRAPSLTSWVITSSPSTYTRAGTEGASATDGGNFGQTSRKCLASTTSSYSSNTTSSPVFMFRLKTVTRLPALTAYTRFGRAKGVSANLSSPANASARSGVAGPAIVGVGDADAVVVVTGTVREVGDGSSPPHAASVSDNTSTGPTRRILMPPVQRSAVGWGASVAVLPFSRRGAGVVDRGGLENRCTALRYRGFESHPLRQ